MARGTQTTPVGGYHRGGTSGSDVERPVHRAVVDPVQVTGESSTECLPDPYKYTWRVIFQIHCAILILFNCYCVTVV